MTTIPDADVTEAAPALNISPLARLYAIAREAGLDVSDSSAGDWPEGVTATVAPDMIMFGPGLEDDATRTDLLAMSIALACSIVTEEEVPDGHVAAPDGYVAILSERVPEPPKGPGRLAGFIARGVGRDTASAAFRFIATADDWAAFKETGDGASEVAGMPEHGLGAPESVLALPTPYLRLYAMAESVGILVCDYDGDVPDWPADTAALVAPDLILLGPDLKDEALRAEIVAFAACVAAEMVTDGSPAKDHQIAAPDGVVAVTTQRIPKDESPVGPVATLFATQCGCDTTSAAFAIRTPGAEEGAPAITEHTVSSS